MERDAFRALLDGKPLLLDGGMGSLLIAAGLERGRAPEHWVLERPERVEAAHCAYVEAGSGAVQTNTFGASPPKLAASGLEGRCRDVNRLAVSVAKSAAAGRALVAGDVGPTGLLRPPMGQATEPDFLRAFREQVSALAEAGADFISIETMFDLVEALAALEAAVETGLPVVASMTFEKKKRGFFTIMGNPLLDSLKALESGGADAAGFNCSVTSGVMLEMVREAAPSLGVPLAAQPNAGQPRAVPEGITYDASPEAFAGDLAAMALSGARILGGCCGTDPGFIRRARTALDALSRKTHA
jgi:methionine synthase I (cobalamin-dependent)